jgi:predicted nucleic acid-binding protein
VRILADSAFVIDYLKGDRAAAAQWREVFDEGDQPVVNEVVVCEVRTGLKPWELRDFEAFLEPVEFVQPAPESRSLPGAGVPRPGRPGGPWAWPTR